MRLQVYSIYDLKVSAYSTPFFSPNDSVALRSFQQVKRDPDSQVYHFPGDFQLYRIGTFTDSDGLLTHEIPPVLISDTSKDE
jgi:hypothetical protein